MKRVQLESPFKGLNWENTEFNLKYAHACVADCLMKGEAPFASHIMYTVATNDKNPVERAFGINAGLTFLKFADKSVVYTDLGVSEGMKKGIDEAYRLGIEVEFRKLPAKTMLNLLSTHPEIQQNHHDLKSIIDKSCDDLVSAISNAYDIHDGKTLKQHFLEILEEQQLSDGDEIKLTYSLYRLFANKDDIYAFYLDDNLNVELNDNTKAKVYSDSLKSMNEWFKEEYKEQIDEAKKRYIK